MVRLSNLLPKWEQDIIKSEYRQELISQIQKAESVCEVLTMLDGHDGCVQH